MKISLGAIILSTTGRKRKAWDSDQSLVSESQASNHPVHPLPHEPWALAYPRSLCPTSTLQGHSSMPFPRCFFCLKFPSTCCLTNSYLTFKAQLKCFPSVSFPCHSWAELVFRFQGPRSTLVTSLYKRQPHNFAVISASSFPLAIYVGISFLCGLFSIFHAHYCLAHSRSFNKCSWTKLKLV